MRDCPPELGAGVLLPEWRRPAAAGVGAKTKQAPRRTNPWGLVVCQSGSGSLPARYKSRNLLAVSTCRQTALSLSLSVLIQQLGLAEQQQLGRRRRKLEQRFRSSQLEHRSIRQRTSEVEQRCELAGCSNDPTGSAKDGSKDQRRNHNRSRQHRRKEQQQRQCRCNRKKDRQRSERWCHRLEQQERRNRCRNPWCHSH